MSSIILDHIENITIDSVSPRLSNPHALDFLPKGLFELAKYVRAEEGRFHPQEPNVSTFYLMPALTPLTRCAFHWFSVSLVNFVRLIGLIKYMNDNDLNCTNLVQNKKVANECKNYVSLIIPEVQKWRDKVSAHFATTDPYSVDGEALLEQVVMSDVSFLDGRLRASAMSWGVGSDISNLPQWSLTETYEKLAARYWPNSRINFDQSKCIPPQNVRFGPPPPPNMFGMPF